MLRVYCLGQFQVQIRGHPVEIPSRPAQSLFAFLALNAGLVHRRERLAGLLWPDSSDENARAYLRQGLWRIRKAFEAGSAAWQDFLQIDEISVCFLKQANTFLDAGFLAQSKTGESWSIDELVEQVQVYAGELLPGFYDEWIILDRERLKSAFDLKMRLLLDRLEASQSWEELVDWAERWIGMGHIPEPAYRALMLAFAAQGSMSSVSGVYQRCQKALREELGVSPSKELREIYQGLLRGEIPKQAYRTSNEIHDIVTAPPAPGSSPYKGLEYFDTGDASLFFGRQQLAKRLAARLYENRFLAVVGASGSGKSSLVRAGLIPAIQTPTINAVTDRSAPQGWQVRIMTPTAHPLQTLVDMLGEKQSFLVELSRDENALINGLRNQVGQQGEDRFLLVFDQFEELFTQCQDEAERRAFIRNLLAAVHESQAGKAWVIISLRADFYAQCGRYPSLREALNTHQEYIGPMTAEELRSAIEEPASRNGWFFEPGLVDLILREVHGEPGALPLLSHALLETWKRRSGYWMTLKGYAEAGGVHGAIARTAEFVFNRRLSQAQQVAARNIFLRLTELGEDMAGTRRRAQASEFISAADQAQGVKEVLEILAAARLVTLSENSVEVAHEALIREWPALRQWLTEDRDGLRLHHHLAEAALYWESLGRDPGDLYRGARLAQVKEWWGEHPDRLNQLESEFIEAACAEEQSLLREKEQQQQRELEAARQLASSEKQRAEEGAHSNRRLRLFAASLSLIFLVTLAAAWVAVDQRNRANRTTHLAHSRELAAAAINNLELDPQLSLLLALEAVEESQAAGEPVSVEIENALHQAVRGSRQRLVLRDHKAGIFGVSYSPDGRLIATASKDGTIKIWDSQTGDLVRTIQGHQAEVMSVVFHPEGRWLVTTSRDYTIRLWEVDNGHEIWSYRGETGFPTLADFSPDGSQVGSAFWDGKAILFDTITGQIWLEIEIEPLVFSFKYHPGGSQFGVINMDGLVQLFDAKNGQELETIDFSSYTQPFIAFSPEGKKMAVASMDGWIKLWDLENSQLLWTVDGQIGSQYGPTEFSPDGKYLVTTSFGRSAQVWDAASGQPVMTFPGHTAAVYTAAFHPEGGQIVTGSEDSTARVWDFSAARELALIPSVKGGSVGSTSRRTAFSPDGSWLVAGEGDAGGIGVYDAWSGKRLKTLSADPPAGEVTSLAYHSGGERLASASMDGIIVIWDPVVGVVQKQWQAHQSPVVKILYLDNRQLLVSLGEDGNVKLWDAQIGELVGYPGNTVGTVFNIAASPDGNSLLTTTFLGALRVVDIHTDQGLAYYRGQIGWTWDVTFSHNGKMIASANDDGSVIVWETEARNKRFIFEHPLSPPVGVAFSPDDRLLATISFDGTLRLWDLESRMLTLVLEKSVLTRPTSVAFSPDGLKIAVTSEDGVSIYLTHLEDLIELAQSRLARPFTPEECLRYAIANGCYQEAPVEADGKAPQVKKERNLVCHLPEAGGVKVMYLNWITHMGMLAASAQLGWDHQTREPIFLQDLGENMQTFLQSGCDLILVNTFDRATVAMPEDHPDQLFWFLEAEDENLVWDNVWAEAYQTDQPSFLAGYLAAATTRTGKIGIYGGQPIPAVLAFMDGFTKGIDYYNQQNAAQVELLGWQGGSGGSGGLFTGFNDPATGYKTTLELIDRGADIIFPVAGDGNLFAASEAALTSKDVLVIGVDQDWAASHPEYASITLTSVIKHTGKSVFWAMEAITNGTFTGGFHYSNLENGGVGLAPFYELDPQIPDSLKAELEQIRQGIVEGEIPTK